MYPAAAIVNDEMFLICFKLCRVKPFKAEFDIKLFILAEFNALNKTDQEFPAGAGAVNESLNEFPRFILRFDGGFFFLLQFPELTFQIGTVGFYFQINPMKVIITQQPGELIHIHSIQIGSHGIDLTSQSLNLGIGAVGSSGGFHGFLRHGQQGILVQICLADFTNLG